MPDWKDRLIAKTELTSPDNAADLLVIVDTSADLLLKTTPNDLLGPGVAAGTGKTTPVDDDLIPLVDSAASNAAKKLTWGNLKATLKTYFDALYQPLSSVLTTIAGLTPSANDVLQYKSGAWANRTMAQLIADLGLGDAMLYKGVIDCSANPNYPAADAGHTYKISVAGKIGGASGVMVEAGDMAICTVDSSSSGTQAGVGANWDVIQMNLVGAITEAGGTFTGDIHVPDDAYDATTWNGSDKVPTKNAIRDKIEAVVAGAASVSDAAYGSGWNGDTTNAPSKNAVYDKIESIGSGGASLGLSYAVSKGTAMP